VHFNEGMLLSAVRVGQWIAIVAGPLWLAFAHRAMTPDGTGWEDIFLVGGAVLLLVLLIVGPVISLVSRRHHSLPLRIYSWITLAIWATIFVIPFFVGVDSDGGGANFDPNVTTALTILAVVLIVASWVAVSWAAVESRKRSTHQRQGLRG